MTRPSTKRKPQRPRLEASARSSISAHLDGTTVTVNEVTAGEVTDLILIADDIKRLRKFLERCEEYLAARKERK